MSTILVTVDALRADRLAQYGYERDTMPALDRLTADGTVFRNAFANAPYTRASVPAFQTSQYLAYDALETLPTIGSILDDHGVRTAIVGTQTGIDLVEGKFGYGETVDLGRDEFHERANRERPLAERVSRRVDTVAEAVGAWLRRRVPERVVQGLKRPYKAVFSAGGFRFHGYTSAEVVTDCAIEWLDAHGDDEFFLWIHYMEAHRPFGVHDDDPAYLEAPLPEGEIRALLKKVNLRPDDVTAAEHRTLVDLYDSDVRYCSRHLSRLFDHLDGAGLWDATTVLFSSDHGEEFGEHGAYGHRNYPYDELVHVPLVVRRAGGGGPAAVDGQRALVDLLPTICGVHGVDPSPYDPAGRDLFEDDDGDRGVLLLGQPKDHAPAAGIRRDGWKYVHAGEDPLLYDLEADPGETENVAAANPDVVDELQAAIPDSLIERDATELRDPTDAADRERLAALGYLEE